MASFDFQFRYEANQATLLKVCLDAAKSRARKLSISWRNVRIAPGVILCVVGGNSRRMDLLGHALERDLPVVAEGAQHTEFSPLQRRRLGLGFADLYVRGRDITSDNEMRWRGTSGTRYYFSPFELSPGAIPPNLAARLAVTESVIIDWCFERLPPVVLLEELHTACELLLEYLVNQRSKRLSFAELVDKADDAGLLRWPLPPVEVPGFPTIEGKTLLIELKDYRKNARHRADTSFEPWIRQRWDQIALLVERLAKSPPAPVHLRSE